MCARVYQTNVTTQPVTWVFFFPLEVHPTKAGQHFEGALFPLKCRGWERKIFHKIKKNEVGGI